MGQLSTSALLAMTLVLGASSTASAESKTFHLRGSRISFVSDAPLETIRGVASGVSGQLTGDPGNIGSTRGRVVVKIRTLRTGIGLRDEHLRGESWLQAARFPDATFEITRTEGASSLRPNQVARITVHGRFTLHGVTHRIVANARVRYVPAGGERQGTQSGGDSLFIQGGFSIRLSDYGISIPTVVRLKVSNQIQIGFALRGIAGV